MKRSLSAKAATLLELPPWYRSFLLRAKVAEKCPLLTRMEQSRLRRRFARAKPGKKEHSAAFGKCYLTAIPHPTVGIGHTLAEYNAGRIFAKRLGLRYAHCPLPEPWESLLNFGEGLETIREIRQRGYRWLRLPRLDSDPSPEQLEDYRGRLLDLARHGPTLFVLGFGQSSFDHSHTEADLRDAYQRNLARLRDGATIETVRDLQLSLGPLDRPAFYSKSVHEETPRRRTERMELHLHDFRDPDAVNVVAHVRRGNRADRFVRGTDKSPKTAQRYLDTDYFLRVCEIIREALPGLRVKFHIFGQGSEKDFEAFRALGNTTFHLTGGPYEAFFNMTVADILVTSPSSFSFKAGMLNPGLKIAPNPWWHEIPKDSGWIRVGDPLTLPRRRIREFYLRKEAGTRHDI